MKLLSGNRFLLPAALLFATGCLVALACAWSAGLRATDGVRRRAEAGENVSEWLRKQDDYYRATIRRVQDSGLEGEALQERIEELQDVYDFQSLMDDLQSVQRLTESILAAFALPDAAGDIQFDETESLRGERKLAAREELMENEESFARLQGEIFSLTNRLQVTGREGVRDLVLSGRSYRIVWRRVSEATTDLTGAEICGFVVDDGLDGALVKKVRRDLMAPLGGSAVLLLAVAVGVLVHFLRQARREALQKTTFVSNVSHELRTPLTSLLSYAEMLSAGRCRTEGKREKALGVILDEGRRLNRMIQELLDFSRLERGTRRYRQEDFDLAETVRETTERLAGRFEANGLGTAVPETLAVRSDRDTVRQILENLLTNAAKYAAKDGPVGVSVEVCGGHARVSVADRGPGLTRAQMKDVFKPFWRADNATTRETGGYGIGLSVARAYARGLGGDLKVTARTGGGCVFAFEFPIKR